MSKPLKRERGISRTLILHSAAKLFIERGYSNTKIHDVSNDCGVTYNEIYRMFIDKDTLLSNLVELVIEHQFNTANEILKDKTTDKVLAYIFESVLQLYIAESKEHIREMYVVSYSMPATSHKIYEYFIDKLESTFKSYLPNYETKDFYELEIASAGIMRGFLVNPCTIYFTMDRKIKRYIESIYKLFEVPKEKIEETINFINQFDMKLIANNVIETLYDFISKRT